MYGLFSVLEFTEDYSNINLTYGLWLSEHKFIVVSDAAVQLNTLVLYRKDVQH
jgi:hypothetical protein